MGDAATRAGLRLALPEGMVRGCMLWLLLLACPALADPPREVVIAFTSNVMGSVEPCG